MKTMIKTFLVVLFFGMAGSVASCFAKEVSPLSNDIDGFYDSMPLPTREEKGDLQKISVSHGVDLNSVLKDLPENDQKAWAGFFKVSMNFTHFDRAAQVYGYQLFTAFSYFIDSVGEAKFAVILNEQPLRIRQRVRDFLYYEAFNSDLKVMKNNERVLRIELKLIFPSSYVFSANDPLFGKFPRH